MVGGLLQNVLKVADQTAMSLADLNINTLVTVSNTKNLSIPYQSVGVITGEYEDVDG